MDKRYLLATTFFIISIIFMVVYGYPKYQEVVISGRVAEEKELESAAQAKLGQNVAHLKSQYTKTKDILAKVDKLIPVYNEGSIANLFVEIENISSRNGMAMESMNFGKEKNAGKTKGKKAENNIVNMSFSLVGDYVNLKRFTKVIETNGHLMDIVSISVKAGSGKDEKENESQELSFNVSVNVYYQ